MSRKRIAPDLVAAASEHFWSIPGAEDQGAAWGRARAQVRALVAVARAAEVVVKEHASYGNSSGPGAGNIPRALARLSRASGKGDGK
jgi:hypothetical protein